MWISRRSRAGTALAYIRGTEWTRYTVTVAQAGDYRVELRAAAWNGARTVRILAGPTEIGTVTVPQTASSGVFTTATTTVHLDAGTQALKFAFSADALNLDRAVFTAVAPTATPTPTSTPTANVTPTANITATPTANVTPTETVTPTVNGTPTTSSAVPVPDGAGVPTDSDGDGRYDDVNGNGRTDFADVVLYFNQMIRIADHEPVAFFDYNGNGRVDFADVVWLFNNL